MMPSYALVAATTAHVAAIVALLSDEDRAELTALGDGSALLVLLGAFGRSVRCWCGLVDDRPIFLAGVRTNGTVWMVATPEVARARKFYLRATRQMCAEMMADTPVIYAVVDTRYTRSLRWLAWLGFRIGPPFKLAGRSVVAVEKRKSV